MNTIDLILDSGYSKPTALMKMVDKEGLVSVLTKHYTILRSKAEPAKSRPCLFRSGSSDG